MSINNGGEQDRTLGISLGLVGLGSFGAVFVALFAAYVEGEYLDDHDCLCPIGAIPPVAPNRNSKL